MKRLFLFLLISAATLCSTSAQDLKGTVNDEQGHPVEFATVALRSLPDSSVITGVITDINGQFTIERKGTERGFVQISSVGYETQDIAVSAFAKEQSITLKSDNKVLDEVVVSKVRPKTTISGDAVVTSISGSVLEHAGNSLDVLSKIPGMISRNGTLEVVGRGEPLYYINGRRVTDNSELRNLMSEDIKSIDVVSNPGAEYGGEVRCVVRIRTVKRQGEGFSFSLTSQAAKHIYKCHDAEPSWSVLDLNYRKNGLDVLGKIV
ncbi:MAG: carboxypeptidase-like regulatory domain-containing protein, partial [Bacteroidales bacterium]|nr:carboxypeptidase-like regulatory domain-containing protein [Bacteroidales bacterium]